MDSLRRPAGRLPHGNLVHAACGRTCSSPDELEEPRMTWFGKGFDSGGPTRWDIVAGEL
jgi:hypothetical protein